MKLISQHTKDFRNIKDAIINAHEKITVISGKNGQGKTNMLESIWLLTGAKSFRTQKDIELIKKDEIIAKINGECENSEKGLQIDIDVFSDISGKKGRYAKINGVDYKKATNIAGIFNCVVFAPEHLNLIKGSPDMRRRFLDAAICQLYPSYIKELRKYNRYIIQKNSLLKKGAFDKKEDLFLDALDEGIVAAGNNILLKRNNYLAEFNKKAICAYSDISNKKEELQINYLCCEDLKKEIEISRKKDKLAGFCTCGVHRDDLEIKINDSSAKSFASQGQQRSAALSMKLAEAKNAFEITGEHPVMLLDDVLSELDEERQNYLLNNMQENQSVVTCCDFEVFKKTNGFVYIMENGKITRSK